MKYLQWVPVALAVGLASAFLSPAMASKKDAPPMFVFCGFIDMDNSNANPTLYVSKVGPVAVDLADSVHFDFEGAIGMEFVNDLQTKYTLNLSHWHWQYNIYCQDGTIESGMIENQQGYATHQDPMVKVIQTDFIPRLPVQGGRQK